MKTLLFIIALSFIFGFRSIASLSIGAIICYLLGNLLVISGTGTWVIPLLTIVMAVALAGKIKKLINFLLY